MRKRSRRLVKRFGKTSAQSFEVVRFFFVRDRFDSENAVVAFDEVHHADEDVVEGDLYVFALEFPEVCGVLERRDFRVVHDHVVFGPGGIGVVVGVNDFVETNSATGFDGSDNSAINKVFALRIRRGRNGRIAMTSGDGAGQGHTKSHQRKTTHRSEISLKVRCARDSNAALPAGPLAV